MKRRNLAGVAALALGLILVGTLAPKDKGFYGSR